MRSLEAASPGFAGPDVVERTGSSRRQLSAPLGAVGRLLSRAGGNGVELPPDDGGGTKFDPELGGADEGFS